MHCKGPVNAFSFAGNEGASYGSGAVVMECNRHIGYEALKHVRSGLNAFSSHIQSTRLHECTPARFSVSEIVFAVGDSCLYMPMKQRKSSSEFSQP